MASTLQNEARMIRLIILDIESSLSPGTLFERASQALRECKLTADWEIQQGEAFESESLPAAAASPQPCEDPVIEERYRYSAFHRAAYGREAPEEELTDERMEALAEYRAARARKRIAAAHQEAEHAS